MERTSTRHAVETAIERSKNRKLTWEKFWEESPDFEEHFPSPLEEKPETDGDIVSRLRKAAVELAEAFGEDSGTLLLREAADEIERLRTDNG